ncbi:hypothetical protein M409DRAFT_29705 [Zasmidium cellare ATCC 36951]|uniref:Major facilitator superfamily (MFS) profile domain-containing protein n=1 Tax=Zasmidium cellare ATCC 36951 TaxID=1080233 RepID=A0A6A6BYW3_ZASCE|nr:uncharacterized protein M409DRAFT_29705 [Zasmidium cellare ATCC 36951]KAF2159895.1 hypothetical protein M409DRAFT_29705 [Zasmidium cellare ATCC 36951]
MGQPLGYAMGLILGGVLTDTIGWRWGFYITAIADAMLFVASVFVLPSDPSSTKLSKESWRRLAYGIDWMGVAILAIAFALLSYVLAMVTTDYKHILQAHIIALMRFRCCCSLCFLSGSTGG